MFSNSILPVKFVMKRRKTKISPKRKLAKRSFKAQINSMESSIHSGDNKNSEFNSSQMRNSRVKIVSRKPRKSNQRRAITKSPDMISAGERYLSSEHVSHPSQLKASEAPAPFDFGETMLHSGVSNMRSPDFEPGTIQQVMEDAEQDEATKGLDTMSKTRPNTS